MDKGLQILAGLAAFAGGYQNARRSREERKKAEEERRAAVEERRTYRADQLAQQKEETDFRRQQAASQFLTGIAREYPDTQPWASWQQSQLVAPPGGPAKQGPSFFPQLPPALGKSRRELELEARTAEAAANDARDQKSREGLAWGRYVEGLGQDYPEADVSYLGGLYGTPNAPLDPKRLGRHRRVIDSEFAGRKLQEETAAKKAALDQRAREARYRAAAAQIMTKLRGDDARVRLLTVVLNSGGDPTEALRQLAPQIATDAYTQGIFQWAESGEQPVAVPQLPQGPAPIGVPGSQGAILPPGLGPDVSALFPGGRTRAQAAMSRMDAMTEQGQTGLGLRERGQTETERHNRAIEERAMAAIAARMAGGGGRGSAGALDRRAQVLADQNWRKAESDLSKFLSGDGDGLGTRRGDLPNYQRAVQEPETWLKLFDIGATAESEETTPEDVKHFAFLLRQREAARKAREAAGVGRIPSGLGPFGPSGPGLVAPSPGRSGGITLPPVGPAPAGAPEWTAPPRTAPKAPRATKKPASSGARPTAAAPRIAPPAPAAASPPVAASRPRGGGSRWGAAPTPPGTGAVAAPPSKVKAVIPRVALPPGTKVHPALEDAVAEWESRTGNRAGAFVRQKINEGLLKGLGER